MKQTILFTLLIIAVNAMGQTNGGLALTQGTIIETEVQSYKTPFMEDMTQWIKMKPAKKIETIQQYNIDCEAGKLAPISTTPISTKINEITDTNGAIVYTGIDGATKYKLTIKTKGDSVEYTLNDGVTFPIVGKNNDTSGYWYYGIRKLPKKMEIGSIIPGYANEMNLFPYDLTTSRKQYFTFSDVNSATGVGTSYSGVVNIRKTTTMQVNNLFVYTPYQVVSQEEVEVSGKKYIAYKLENENWMKMTSNAVVKEDPSVYFNSDYLTKRINESLNSSSKEEQEKINKKMMSATGMNDEGYYVTKQENWYVPELGIMVKTKSYDFWGALSSESRVVSIK